MNVTVFILSSSSNSSSVCCFYSAAQSLQGVGAAFSLLVFTPLQHPLICCHNSTFSAVLFVSNLRLNQVNILKGYLSVAHGLMQEPCGQLIFEAVFIVFALLLISFERLNAAVTLLSFCGYPLSVLGTFIC